jgi:hypothetical protein
MGDGAAFLVIETKNRELLLDAGRDLMPLIGGQVGPDILPTYPTGDTNYPVFAPSVRPIYLSHIWATFQNQETDEIDIVPQPYRYEQPQTRGLQAYFMGGTIYPIRDQPWPPFQDSWLQVVSLALYGIAEPGLVDLNSSMTIPDVLINALVSHTAYAMSMSSRQCTEQERSRFQAVAAGAETRLKGQATMMIHDETENRVLYRP